MDHSNTIQVSDSQLIPVHKILGCKPQDLNKFSREYILRKIREYYSAK